MAKDKTPDPASSDAKASAISEGKKTGFPAVLHPPKDLPMDVDTGAANASAEGAEADDGDLKDAIEFLKTEMNVPEPALASMGPQAIMDWATEVASGATTDPAAQGGDETQTDIAAILERLNAPKTIREPSAPPATTGDGTAAVEYGEVGAKEFAEMKSRMEAIEANATALGQMYGARVIKDGIARHLEAYPSLKKADVQSRVDQIATNLVQTGTYRDMDKAYDDAVLLHFRGKPEQTTQTSELRKKVAKLKGNSQPTKQGRQEQAKTMDPADLTDRIGKALIGGNREEAKRISAKAGLYTGG